MNLEDRKKFIINFFYFIIVGFIIYIAFKYGIFWFMPFIIGFLVAYLLKPLINFLSYKLRINRKIIAVLSVFLFYGTVGTLFVLLCIKIFVYSKEIFYKMPYIYSTNIEPYIVVLFENIESSISSLDPTMMQSLKDITQTLSQSIGTFVSKVSYGALAVISSIAGSVPSVFIGILLSIISSFFIAIDYPKITEFIMRQLPHKVRSIVVDMKEYISITVFKFIKAYTILITITFIELSIGLSILGINNAITIAALIAIIDIMPVLGTGGIMIPWSIIELVKGNVSLSIGLIIVYIIITIIRNILEPKIVGKQVGLPPLLILMSMFIGVKIFGFLGLFILPITMIIIKNLNDNGKINLFK